MQRLPHIYFSADDFMKGLVTEMRLRTAIILIFVFLIAFWIVMAYAIKRNDEALSATNGISGSFPTIIVDAGHGGMDGGAQGADGTLEKNINLSIALTLNDMLKCFGFETVMTRTEDISIHDENVVGVRQQKISDIHNRMDIINTTPNAIFVSIHQNHYTSTKYSGTQVFYSKNNPLSKELAGSIQENTVKLLQPDNTRTIKASGTEIYLLYHSDIPSVLVECGFLSNVAETEKLNDPEYQSKMSFAVMCGIINAL